MMYIFVSMYSISDITSDRICKIKKVYDNKLDVDSIYRRSFSKFSSNEKLLWENQKNSCKKREKLRNIDVRKCRFCIFGRKSKKNNRRELKLLLNYYKSNFQT